MLKIFSKYNTSSQHTLKETKMSKQIKLKSLLKEGFAWERKPGKPLPTIQEVMDEYEAKQEKEDVKTRKPRRIAPTGLFYCLFFLEEISEVNCKERYFN